MTELNRTHDPARRSWVERANLPSNDFPIQNLPFGVFRNARRSAHRGCNRRPDPRSVGRARSRAVRGRGPRCGASRKRPEPQLADGAGNRTASALRARMSDLLWSEGGDAPARAADGGQVAGSDGRRRDDTARSRSAASPDFLTSIYHTERGGRVTRPDNPVPPPFKYLPDRLQWPRHLGQGERRAGTPAQCAVAQPRGQSRVRTLPAARFRARGRRVYSQRATRWENQSRSKRVRSMFGLCLLNDWSARDIQRWESVLGPFLSKSLSTTISLWVVTAEALGAISGSGFRAAAGDPAPLPYLIRPRIRPGRLRHRPRSVPADATHARRRRRNRSDNPHQFHPHVLDVRANAHPPHEQRMQPASRAICSAAARRPARSMKIAPASRS